MLISFSKISGFIIYQSCLYKLAGSRRFDRLSIFINFMLFPSVLFLVEPENDISFFWRNQ